MSICEAGLDGRAIGSRSLLSFSSGLTLIIWLHILSSTKHFQRSICTGWTINEYPANRKDFYVSGNGKMTHSLMTIYLLDVKFWVDIAQIVTALIAIIGVALSFPLSRQTLKEARQNI